ncbi:hypothetical protein IAR55_005521 [Kwoniella newhampshirensis]|uniref:Chromo domain-containing protein n=1 Tax=Kwoniella newhampshirensis TaxID=1651941 RepID=A0AAW0YWC2_9TREE
MVFLLSKRPFSFIRVELGLRAGMRVMDIGNALCWCYRYVSDIAKLGHNNLGQIPDPNNSPSDEEEEDCGPPAWCDEESHSKGASRVAWEGDYAEVGQRFESLGDDVYEVGKIVASKGGKGDQDELFRVRGKGWMPKDDTWERGFELRKTACEVSGVVESGAGFISPLLSHLRGHDRSALVNGASVDDMMKAKMLDDDDIPCVTE